MNPTATVYSISSNDESSISKISSTAAAATKTTTNSRSNLMNGGLCGLQNLGNTVKFNECGLFLQRINLLVFHEFGATMFVEYKTSFIVLFGRESR